MLLSHHHRESSAADTALSTHLLEDDAITAQWFETEVHTEKRDLVSSASSWLARGSAAGAILTMVLGPVGFVAGGIVGGVLSVIIGLITDAIHFRKSKREAELQKEKLEQILRWAEYVLMDADDPAEIFVYVVLEFQGVVLMQNQNDFTRGAVRRFRDFLEKNVVQECAMRCVENFFRRWRVAEAREIAICQAILQTCVTTFQDAKRKPAVYAWMGELLRRPQVKRLFAGVTEENKELRKEALKRKDWLIFADLDIKPQEVFRQDFARRFFRRNSSRAKTLDVTGAQQSSLGGGSVVGNESIGNESQASPQSIDTSYREVAKGASVERRAHYSKKSPSFSAFMCARNKAPHPFFDSSNVETTTVQELKKRRAHSSMSVERALTAMDLTSDTLPAQSISHAVTIGSIESREEEAGIPIKIRGDPYIPTVSPTWGIKSEGATPVAPPVAKRPSTQFREVTPSLPSSLSSSAAEQHSKDAPLPVQLASKVQETIDSPKAAIVASRPPTDALPSPPPPPPPPEIAEPPVEAPRDLEVRPAAASTRRRGGRTPAASPASLEHKSGEAPSATAESDEKRIFASFEDLVNFQPELKHKVPIALYEFDFLDEFEPESRNDKSWEMVTDKGHTRVYKRIVTVRGSDLVMVKGYATMKDIPAAVVLWNIRDTPRRTAWDTTFEGFVLVERNILDNEIVYNTIRAPWPVASRDFLQWRRTIIDPRTNVIKIFHRSAEHPGFPEPNGQSMIRAESIISAYIIRPTEGGRSCELFLMTQTDIRGMIPRWIVNSTAGKAPYGWIENLRKACRETIKQHGGQTVPPYNPQPLYENGIKVMS